MTATDATSVRRTLVSLWDTQHPALCRERVKLMSVLLDQQSSLLTLRRRSPVFVRMIHRYYTAVRPLADVHAGRAALGLLPPTCDLFHRRCLRGLPVLVHEVSRRALGSSTTQDCPKTCVVVFVHLAFRNPNNVGVLIAGFRSSIPSPPIPLFTLHGVPRDAPCKTRGRADR
jgi:hypothetical protein